MGRQEAGAACATAAATLTQAMSKWTDARALSSLAEGLSSVAARMGQKEAAVVCAAAATTLTQAMSKTTDPPRDLADGLSAVLSSTDWNGPRRRHGAVAATVTQLSDPWSLLTAPTLLRPALEPLPPPLPAQVLVDLLKDPLCVGAARRPVLDQLGRHYGRYFADQWEFARFAQEQKLGLDLLSPPRQTKGTGKTGP
jgi:hypothetical protein